MSPEQALTNALQAAVVVRPGDTLVIGLHRDDLTPAEAVDMRDRLQALVPAVRVIVVAGVAGLAVGRR